MPWASVSHAMGRVRPAPTRRQCSSGPQSILSLNNNWWSRPIYNLLAPFARVRVKVEEYIAVSKRELRCLQTSGCRVLGGCSLWWPAPMLANQENRVLQSTPRRLSALSPTHQCTHAPTQTLPSHSTPCGIVLLKDWSVVNNKEWRERWFQYYLTVGSVGAIEPSLCACASTSREISSKCREGMAGY